MNNIEQHIQRILPVFLDWLAEQGIRPDEDTEALWEAVRVEILREAAQAEFN